MTCAKETRDLIIECCVGAYYTKLQDTTDELIIVRTEFIHLISSEANEICDQESKKTIAPEHIIGALKVRTVLPVELALNIDFLASWFRLFHNGC